MFNPLCFLLLVTFCLQHVHSRHVVVQPFYLPYSDYSYSYSGPGPSYQQHHSAFFSPPGTYFDQRQGILRPFPGGGVPVLVDYHKRCSNQYVGLKAHPDQKQHYYVCKPDCVIFGKCQNLQIFNSTSGQCVQHPPPEYKPTCTEVGRFPIFSDCHLYFKCEEDLKPKIYSCPISMIFSPISKKCINGNKCTPTQISPQSSYIPEVCANKFPPCFENGIFRSPSDCSLYYKCELNKDGFFIQTRLRCPQGKFYDLQKNECLPANIVPCDCIQVAELVYPKPNTMPYQPPMYPAQFDLTSLEESQYPVEQTKTEHISDSPGNPADKITLITTLAPTTLNNVQNDGESAVLSDYIDIGGKENAVQNKELEALALKINEAAISSEESTTTQGPGFEDDSEEIEHLQPEDENTQSVDQFNHEVENVVGTTATTTAAATTTNDVTHELTGSPGKTIEEIADTSTEIPLTTSKPEDKFTNFEKVETTNTQELDQGHETTTATITDPSNQPKFCENILESDSSNDTATHKIATAETQTQKCSPKFTTTIPNLHSEPAKTIAFESKLPKQHFATITTLSNTLSPTITLTQPPPIENTVIADKKILMSNLLKSGTNFETRNMDQTTDSNDSNISKPNEQGTLRHMVNHRNSIDSNLIENDVSYEDTLEAEKIKAQNLKAAIQTKDIKNELNGNFQIFTEKNTARPLRHSAGNDHLQKAIKKLKSGTTTIKRATVTLNAETKDQKLSSEGISHNSSKSTNSSEFTVLDSTNTIDDINNLTHSEKMLDAQRLQLNVKPTNFSKKSNPEHISTIEKSVSLRQVDLSNEGFIPIDSKAIDVNKLTEEKTDYFERGFDDDYTTIISERELDTTTVQDTTLRRLQTSSDETTKTISSEPFQQVNHAASTTTTERAKTIVNTKNEIVDLLGVLDSEVVIPEQSQEVSNNEITSAETIQTESNSKQKQFPNTFSTNLMPTQMPVTIPINTPEPSAIQTNDIVLHIRKSDNKQPTLNLPPTKSLYYILDTKPVINNKDNKFNNKIVTAPPAIGTTNGNIPRLEIIAERPIDVHLSICPTTCNKNHKHKTATTGKRAVLLKWFANKSQQTLGFETANGLNSNDNSDC